MQALVRKLTVLIATLAFGLSAPASTKTFSNSFVAFRMPDDWTCKLEEAVWVCAPPPVSGKWAMLAMLAAKCVGPTDSPQLYEQHLEEVGRKDGVTVGTPPAVRLLGHALWVDGAMWNSEVPGYETRYLARTEGAIAVLVTFSAHGSVTKEADAISNELARSVVMNTVFVRPELGAPPCD